MQIELRETYLSITTFPQTELPDFTLITGVNGAGKSHLLQAIQSGHITTNIATANTSTQEIRLFDWNTLIPQDASAFTSENLNQEIELIRQTVSSLRAHPQSIEPMRAIARKYGFPSDYIVNPFKIIELSSADICTILQNNEVAQNIFSEISVTLASIDKWILQQVDANMQAVLITASKIKNKSISLIEPNDINSGIPNWGRSNLFQQSFARLFVAYRDAYLSNMIAELQFNKGNSDSVFLTDDEFIKRNGQPPWQFVNDTIQKAGLDFTINIPDQNSFSPYTPQLTKNTSGVKIPFSSLSSGEKILMSFAFCIYYANDRRQLAVYPKLILFDEIDAPLHPSMAKNLVDTITDILVGKFGIKVIATTHSPSTVALAPNGSIYIMRPGEPGLKYATKSKALNILTTGVPTLAISHDGRRQVFVESPADAITYDAIYSIVRQLIPSDRSLDFIATGTRSKTGSETNVGCDVVKRIVSSLVETGNQSVFGLIDFDNHHKGTDRIVVLGGGERNGLENFILDPAIICVLICRDCIQNKEEIGIDCSINYLNIDIDNVSIMQNYVNNICNKVFGNIEKTKEVKYYGGLSLFIDSRWLTLDDHELENRIISTFPFLKNITKNHAGKFMQHIIATVLTEHPRLMPIDLINTFIELLDRDAHI